MLQAEELKRVKARIVVTVGNFPRYGGVLFIVETWQRNPIIKSTHQMQGVEGSLLKLGIVRRGGCVFKRFCQYESCCKMVGMSRRTAEKRGSKVKEDDEWRPDSLNEEELRQSRLAMRSYTD